MNAQLTQALWDLSRGTGAVALVMLSLSLCLGVLTRSTNQAGRPDRASSVAKSGSPMAAI